MTDVLFVEVSGSEYNDDEALWAVAPVDETRCDGCDERIGAHFRQDPDTSADKEAFTAFWQGSDGRLLCEDCMLDATEPTWPTEANYFDPRDPAINELAERLAEELRVPVSVDYNYLTVHVTIADARRLLNPDNNKED